MKKPTVEKAVIDIINDLHDNYVFSGLWLTRKVRNLREDNTMDGSILRQMRRAKISKPPKLNYETVNRRKSLYRKLSFRKSKYRIERKGQLCLI